VVVLFGGTLIREADYSGPNLGTGCHFVIHKSDCPFVKKAFLDLYILLSQDGFHGFGSDFGFGELSQGSVTFKSSRTVFDVSQCLALDNHRDFLGASSLTVRAFFLGVPRCIDFF
jgi:hypothetical protein